MTNSKLTKKALLTSVMALFLCVAMLTGTTFAWFTDTVTSSGNKIVAGDLQIDLEVLDKTTSKWNSVKTSNAPIFNYDKWEPGYVDVKLLKVENEGSLALKWKATLVSTGELSKLADVIDVYVRPYGVLDDATTVVYPADRNLDGYDKVGTLREFVNTLETTTYGNLNKDEAAYLGIALKMHEEADNNYKGISLGEFDITILATQLAAESDSIDNTYDKDAIYAEVLATTNEELKEAITNPKYKLIAVKGDLTYDWGGNSYENSKALDMKGKTIVGFDAASSITFAGYGSANPITDVTLKNITVRDVTVGDNENSWEHGYLEFINLKAENVVFADTIMLDGDSMLVNCSMSNNTAYWYGIWIEGGNTIIKNCAFSGTRSIKIHEAYGSDVKSVVIDDCVIGALSEKPGVVIGDLDADTVVTIKNTMFVNVPAGDQNEYFYESDTAVTAFKFVTENNTILGRATIAATGEEFIAATAGGDVVITDDIIYNNTDPDKQMIMEATSEIKFHGNGATITTEGADPSVGNHGYVAFVPPAGEGVTVSDLTVTGEGFVELGHYGIGGGDYVANNLVVKNLVSTLANGDKGKTLACGFAHYGNATLNNCTMTGTTAMIDGAMAVDAGFANSTTTLVNGGKYGTIYCWSHAVVTLDGAEVDTLYVSPIKGTVTVKAGTEIEKLVVDYGTSASNVTQARLQKLIIEDGATVNEIIYAGNTYTVDTWNDFVVNFGA